MLLSGNHYKDLIIINKIPVIYSFSVANTYIDPLFLTEDGILGLGNDETSIVYQIYTQSQIDKPIYSLYFTETHTFLMFGSVNYTNLSFFLQTQAKISYKPSLFAEFHYKNTKFEAFPIEFNSLDSHISGPYSQLQYFFNDLINNYQCVQYSKFITCACDKQYPNLEFQVQSQILMIKSEFYLKKVKIKQIEKFCFINVNVNEK